ncbi:hypothetical protein [Microbacterium sp.]|uniref:hypothetical protein n=1 Tax=Microbacterium sp. TaxID=51671 RepID=UPI00281224F7|nr:hypothetical protein [Microbacterium sp.]
MTHEPLKVPSSLWDAPPPALRRHPQPSGGLPAAAPVAHAASAPPVHRGRLIAGFTTVAVIGVVSVTAGLLAGTSADHRSPSAAGTSEPASSGPVSAASLTGEAGSRAEGLRVPERRVDADEAPIIDDGEGLAPPRQERSDETSDAVPPLRQDPGGSVPVTNGAAPPRGSAVPGPSSPSSPDTPAPSPSAPAPAPAPPPPTATPAPLRFTGLTANYALSLLGVRLLSSYTLSLSGEPGATASVTYGGRSAGSVTFGGDGHASLNIGGDLLDLSDPMVRATYSDGTNGAAIEAPRDSI